MGIVALWTPCLVFKTCSDLYTVPVIIPPLLMCPVKTMNLLSCPAQNSLLEESNISHCRRQTHPSFCVKLKRLNGTRLVKHRNRWFWALLDEGDTSTWLQRWSSELRIKRLAVYAHDGMSWSYPWRSWSQCFSKQDSGIRVQWGFMPYQLFAQCYTLLRLLLMPTNPGSLM